MSDKELSSASETAIFGGGCFWCIEAVFKDVEGVLGVQSGYCGGHVSSPSYREVCGGGTGHAEVVRIEFDPEVISYRELLEIFFVVHDPTTLNRQGNDVGTQYRSAIFPTSETQLHTALALIEEMGRPACFPRRSLPKWSRRPSSGRRRTTITTTTRTMPTNPIVSTWSHPRLPNFASTFRSDANRAAEFQSARIGFRALKEHHA